MTEADAARWSASRHWAALLVVALAAARGLLVAVVVPPLQAPDEDAHVDAVQYLAETGRLPPGGACETVSAELDTLERFLLAVPFHPDRIVPRPGALRMPVATAEARATPGCGPAGTYPPVYYLTAAVAYRATQRAPFLHRLFAMRLVSVVWGCAGALAAFLFGLLAFRRTGDGLLLGVLWVAHPQIGLLTGTVNNDAALFAIGAACFAAAAALARGARPRRVLPVLALLALAGGLTKPTFVGVLPVLLVAIALTLGGGRPRSWLVGAAVVAPALVASVLWQQRVFTPPYAPMPLWTFLTTLVLDPVRLEYLWVRLYWMTWGWVDTSLALPWYRLLEAVVIVAALGAVTGWSRLSQDGRRIVALAVLATLGQLAFLYMVEYRIGVGVLQGRYLLPMFVPQMAGCVVGLRAVGRRLGARLDAGWILALLLIAAEVASVVRALERYHGPTPLGRARAWALEYGGDFFPPALALATAACLAALLVAARGLAHGGPAEDERV